MTLQQILIAIPSFLIVLGVVVFVHEFGHFQAARLRKVAVDTFSIGFGKALLSWRDKQGVIWKVGAVPLGGYVKFADDADGVSMGPREVIDDPAAKAEARRKGMFHAQSLLTRSIVVAAGPVTNFIFAIFAFALFFFASGVDVTDATKIPARIGAIEKGSAAEAAGLREGDVVTAVNGQPTPTWSDFQRTIPQGAGHALSFTVQGQNHQLRQVSVTPRLVDHLELNGKTERRWLVGVGPKVLPSEHVIENVSPIEAITLGAAQTWGVVAQTGNYVGGMIIGRNSGSEIAGPLGILAASGRSTSNAVSSAMETPGGGSAAGIAGMVALSLLFLAAHISVAVGIVNLLPIPVLDGGHLFFYVIEAARRGRPLPPEAQEWAFRAGLAVMASLFLFATWNDVTRHLWSQG